MFLIASVILALAACFVTWKVAYHLANPSAPQEYSKSIGFMTALCALPFIGASIYCAYRAAGQGFAVAMAVAVFIAILIASPVGEEIGKRDKASA